ncbi:MAG: GAF domain-containing protein [Pseudomonadota bacterium]|nr:GAF domain-containing protein [Pseudomonadota bacterium]
MLGIDYEMLNDFDQIQDHLQNNQDKYQVSTLAPRALCVHSKQSTLYLIASEVWGNRSLSKHLQDKSKLCVYVVQRDDLPTLPSRLRSADYLKIISPISSHNLHAMLALINKANGKAGDISDAGKEIRSILFISQQLNSSRDVVELLNLILAKAMEITNADAGSIYDVVHPSINTDGRAAAGEIRFRFAHNNSVQQNLTEFSLPINESSIVGRCALQAKPINSSGLYNCQSAQHDRSFDKTINYQTSSMLTAPIFDISRQVIGVIQLLNRKTASNIKLTNAADYGRHVVPFNQDDIDNVEIIAQQSGIALENARMQEEIKNMFDGFVDASVTAIEQRDPSTSGHSHRVAKLTLDLAKVVNSIDNGRLRMIRFSEQQMMELRYASLLHDFGKLGVREQVLVKAKKLYPWEMELLKERFKLIKASYEINYLQKMLALHKEGKAAVEDIRDARYQRERQTNIDELNKFLEFILNTNEPNIVVAKTDHDRIKSIADRMFKDIDGEERSFLTANDQEALSITKGSLTDKEFYEIQEHVKHTYNFLKKIPWGKNLSNVPLIAAKHHEKLDGSGYPHNLTTTEIPIQSRIMTIADIFDALTAADRPYKKSLSPHRALDIMSEEVNLGKLDETLFDLFVESKGYLQVMQKVD